jgi:putative FmdB family regulatory protein
MPRYVYRCEKCENVFQIAHSIKEKLTDCEECKTKETLKRIPSMPLILTNKEGKQKEKVGTLVKKHIEDTKEELKQEKKNLQNQIFKK